MSDQFEYIGGNYYPRMKAYIGPDGTATPISAANPMPVGSADPTAGTGTLSVADSASTTSTNSIGQTIVTGTPTANSAVSLTVSGQSTARVTLVGSGFTGTAAFEASSDGGTTWQGVSGFAASTTYTVATYTGASSERQVYLVGAGGRTQIRVRATARSAGSLGVTIQPGYGGEVSVVGMIAPGELHLGEIGGKVANPSASFTRPADTTAYASGDLVANSTTSGSVTPMSFTAARVAAGNFMIRRARLSKSGTGVTNAAFRLHLFTASPGVTNGDNGVFLSTQAATYLGYFDVTSMMAFSDGASGIGAPGVGSEHGVALASGQTIYGLTEPRGAYTPISAEVFTWTLEDYQN